MSLDPNESPKKTYRTMALAAFAIMALLGLAIYSLSQLSTSPFSHPLRAPTIQATYRQPLPAFEFSEGGKRYDASIFTGHWTLLSFWSVNCGPCLVEMPDLNLLAQGWTGPDFHLITVNTDTGENLESAKLFLSEQQITLETVFDRQGVLAKAFGVEALPRHILIAPDAKMIWTASGGFRWNEAKTRDQLLKVMELAEEKSQDPPESP